MATNTPPSAEQRRRPTRKLKPEVAARLAAQRRQHELKDLYQTPIERLSPEDLARMKAAFLRG